MPYHASLIVFPALNITALIFMIGTYVVIGLGFFPDGRLMQDSITNVFATYKLQIEPSEWVFVLWILIYTYQLLWIMYTLGTILCSTGSGFRGFPSYMDPQHIPNTVVYASIVCSVLNSLWVVLFSHHMIVSACVLLFITTPLQYLMIGTQLVSLSKATPELESVDRSLDVWVTRICMIEGMSLMATLSTTTTFFNFGMVYRYTLHLDPMATAILVQLMFLIGLLTWFVLDIKIMDKFTRYIVSPYIVTCLVQLAIVTNIPVTQALSYGLLSVYVFMTLIKCSILVHRHRNSE
ncbi:hypothetical protein ElyMa_005789300 [Elysia marginata]|uniref:Uncharacterized protein n=1 Tax=Elysia marginata TaxID=1093978 RepID=A0AAV4FT79_9GAST|nr:hypothetical protein ElyMa_005789300 [Elysia marginata]